MDTNLRGILARAGRPTEVLEQADGSSILVLVYGGRVLGLYSAGSSENFLWTHPALQSEASASAFYSSEAWHNSGGDRAWMAPEVDFFFPNFPDLSCYVQPRELDPGSYKCTREAASLTLTNDFSLRLSRSGRITHLRLTRRLSAATHPLRDQSPELAAKLAYAGYSLHSRLEFTDSEREHPMVGLWNLLQMPHGGELLISTVCRSKVRTYMGTISPRDLTITDHLIRYRMNAAGEHKLGISAVALTGRAGYLYRSADGFCLIVRNFALNPLERYIDVPCHDPQSDGSALEACNVNSSLGAFSELEYHAPAMGGPDGTVYCDDGSHVWAFRGAEEDILEAGKILLLPHAWPV